MMDRQTGKAQTKWSGWARTAIGLLVIVALLWLLFAATQWGRTAAQEGTDIQPEVNDDAEANWHPDYLNVATGDPDLLAAHGVYAWPVNVGFTIGHAIQSYQNYGSAPYFHHGIDIMFPAGTAVYCRSGGQVVNVEKYGDSDYYWEVAVLDPDGYVWQYHHINRATIPQTIWDKYYEYQEDPVNGGFVGPDTYIGNNVTWPSYSFHHIHLNILGAGGAYVNGMEFMTPLADTTLPTITTIGWVKNKTIQSGNTINTNSYSLYVRAKDLTLSSTYYLPPYEVTFSIDGGPATTVWRFDNLPGGWDRYAYVSDYFLSPTCGNYTCREFYMDLGFMPGSYRTFPPGGPHTVSVTVRDFAGNSKTSSWTYTVTAPTPTPLPTPIPTATPPPTPVADVLYLSVSKAGSAGGVAFGGEDVLSWNSSTGGWAMVFDGSDVGVTTNVDGFHLLEDGSLLLSFGAALAVPGVGTVADADLVRFVPYSLGPTTAGTFTLHFDGSDVGLTTANEDVDAIGLLPDGRLVLSFLGPWSVTGAAGADEDLAAFTPTSLGDMTTGSWALYFDGSDVQLTLDTEDVNGTWLDPGGSDIFLTTNGAFSVAGAAGDGADIFVCHPSSVGPTTACTYGPGLYWDGSSYGLSGLAVDAFAVLQGTERVP